MKKYNNNMFTKFPERDASMRLNKGSRFSGTSSDISRYSQQKQPAYQYAQSMNDVPEMYQSSSDQQNMRSGHFYGQGLPKRSVNSNPMQKNIPPPPTPPFTHTSATLTSLSPPSSFLPAANNALNLPPSQTSTTQLPATTVMHDNQQQQPSTQPQQFTQSVLDNSSYYGFSYNNFYSTYNPEMMASTTVSAYGLPDAISPYMWQTITTTPPPKLPQKQQQQQFQQSASNRRKQSSSNCYKQSLSNRQRQLPIIPPLPPDDGGPRPLPPPPPMPPLDSETSLSTTKTDNNKKNENDQETGKISSKTIIKMKLKRRAMSTRYKINKSWSEVDVALALKAEEANVKKQQKDIILILRFPDPEISREIVKCYSPDIESVHFQSNYAPRHCLVHLKPGTDVDKTMDSLSKIPFGTGFLSVEIKQAPHRVHSTKLHEIDPYTLYVGNLPTTIACKTLKEHFPGAARIDIGFAQRMKYTRYAFIRYQTVEQAIEAYNRMLDVELGGRTLTIRFRRLISLSNGDKDGDVENANDLQEDILNQPTVTSEDNLMTLHQSVQPSEGLEENGLVESLVKSKEKEANTFQNKTSHLDEDNASKAQVERDKSNEVRINTGDSALNAADDPIEGSSFNENNPNIAAVSSELASESTSSENLNISSNIKPDPDIDPDDIVIRNNNITTRFDISDDNIKQEKELGTDFEFFAPISSQSVGNREKSVVSDTASIHSTTDETDTMSTMSVSSLGEFLQTCQRPQVESNDIDDIIGPPPTKRNKQYNEVLNTTIKTESLNNQNTTLEDNSEMLSNDRIKREVAYNKENTSVHHRKNNMNAVFDDNVSQSINANKIVLKRRELLGQRKNNAYKSSIKKSLNNADDVVPPNALFLRRDFQNSQASCNDVSDNDEFFETRTKVAAKISEIVRNVKAEPVGSLTSERTMKNTINYNQRDSLLQNRVTEKYTTQSHLQYIGSVVSVDRTTLPADEDDLVPEQNILCSRLCAQTEFLNVCNNSSQQALEIKREKENDDIFSIPPKIITENDTTNNVNEDSELNDLWNTNLLTKNTITNPVLESPNIQKTKEVSQSYTSKAANDDDDIILVSENISLQSKHSTCKSSPAISNISSYNQTNLLTFIPKPSSAITNLESSKLLSHHHDNLDKLFEQLDSDSDGEL